MYDLANLSRTEVDKGLRDSMLRLLYAVAAIFIGLNAFSYQRNEEFIAEGISGGHFILLADATILLLTVLMIFWLRRKTRTVKQLHIMGSILLLAAATDALFSAAVMQSPKELFFLPLMCVSAGAVVLYRVFVWTTAAIGLVMVIGAASYFGTTSDVIWAASIMGSGALVAAVTFESRWQQFLNIEELRKLDHENNIALQTAIKRAEAELAERKEADVKRLSAEAEGAALKEQLRKDLRLKAMGTLAGGVAHDMNNVLTAIYGVAESSLEEIPMDANLRADLQHILTAAERGTSLTRNLLGFARKGKRRNEPFEAREIASSVIALLLRTAPKRVEFSLEVDGEVPAAMGDADQIGHALMNICLNALEATEGSTKIGIKIGKQYVTLESPIELPRGVYTTISIHDDGRGMDAETTQQVFDPFFTTKGDGHSGLGLPMVFGTLAEHEGLVTIASDSSGTTVTMFIPASKTPPPPRPSPSRTKVITAKPVLVIDDEDLVRLSVQRMLTNLGLTSVGAVDGFEAIELLKKDTANFAAIILDLSMPKLSGTECLQKIRDFDTHTPIIIASGYPKNQDIDALLNMGAFAFLPKPFTILDLRNAIAGAITEDTTEPK